MEEIVKYSECSCDEEEEEDWNEILDTDDNHQFGEYTGNNYQFGEYTESSESVEQKSVSGQQHDAPILSSHGVTTISRMTLNDHKAGMEGLDKEKINKIIHDASKGSKYYENEKRKEKRVMEKIEAMKIELTQFNDNDRKKAYTECNKILHELEERRDLSRTLIHIDMDAFYAAVEMRDDPKLKDIPMAVGSNAMLSTSNYAARKFGVRAAMPGFIAKKLCPDLVIVGAHFDKYHSVSKQVREIFQEYDPNYLPVSLDEAYLDLTDYISENYFKYNYENNSEELIEIVVNEIREKIFLKTELTASAGIGPNMMLAKICSDINKPNGQYYLKPDIDIIKKFMIDLPIRKISGIGRVSEQMLKAINVEKCGDLLNQKETLYLLFSESSFSYFMEVGLGISTNRIVHGKRKSMSAERTFNDVSDTETLLDICLDLCKNVAEDLEKENLKGYNVTLKYKLSSFITKTRSKTISHPVCKSDELYRISKELLLKEIQSCGENKFELRLMGVRVSNFETKESQKQPTLDSLFANTGTCQQNNNTPDCGPSSNSNECHSSAVVDESFNLDGSRTIGVDVIECPICGRLQNNNEIMLNSHIDDCLTKQTINEILNEQRTLSCNSQVEQNKKNVITKTDNGSNHKDSRKRKSQEPDNVKKKVTLHTFWKKK